MSILTDWNIIRSKGVDIWGVTKRPTRITFSIEQPPGTIRLVGSVSKVQNTSITSKAKSIRSILQNNYPTTCTGSILVEISTAVPTAPDEPTIEPELPPTTPPSDNDNIYYV